VRRTYIDSERIMDGEAETLEWGATHGLSGAEVIQSLRDEVKSKAMPSSFMASRIMI
jgi:hypothetical protein